MNKDKPLRVFLSSSFLASDERREDVVVFRNELKAAGARFGADIELAEEKLAGVTDHVLIMETCGRMAREADAFVGLIHSRHGTRINLLQDGHAQQAEVSIFESELLNACMKEKPTLLIQIEGFSPGPALTEFLGLIEPVLGGSRVVARQQDVETVIRTFVETIRAAKAAKLPWLPDRVGRNRTHANLSRELSDPRLTFLHGGFPQGGGEANASVIERGLASSRAGFDPQLGKLGQGSRLSLLWLAMRELMKASEAQRSGELFDLWTGTLGEWNSAAAWFGLHGFHPMGCLATLNSLTRARRSDGFQIQPVGPRASAYYSTAGQMRAPAFRKELYGHALKLAHAATKGKAGLELASALGLRASCRLKHGGHLAAPGALGDYHRALRLREKHGADDFAVGESMSEYGYAVGRVPLRGQEGLRLVERGAETMLRAGIEHPSRLGFYLRARKKQGELLILQKRKVEAADLIREAIVLGNSGSVSDQVSQLEDLLKRALPPG